MYLSPTPNDSRLFEGVIKNQQTKIRTQTRKNIVFRHKKNNLNICFFIHLSPNFHLSIFL